MTCIFETVGGDLQFQKTGVQKTAVPTPNDTIIWQKGLRPPASLPTRTHQSVLSRYYIRNGNGCVNVPWSALAWMGDYRNRPPLPTSTCGHCGRCAACKRGPQLDDLKIVKVRNARGEFVFGWFVVEQKNAFELVQLHKTTIGAICRKATNSCPCGRCTHPVKSMRSVTMKTDPLFSELAARLFCSFKRVVKRAVVAETHKRGVKRKIDDSTGDSKCAQAEQCIVCLEDKALTFCCQAGTCSSKLCSDCQTSMRGMCPICDRSKLRASYCCASCDAATQLQHYGAPCAECGDLICCTVCYKSFGRCTFCEQKAVQRPFENELVNNNCVLF